MHPQRALVLFETAMMVVGVVGNGYAPRAHIWDVVLVVNVPVAMALIARQNRQRVEQRRGSGR